MRPRSVLAVVAVALSIPAVASAAQPAPKSLSNPELTGYQLIQRFENNLAPTRTTQLASFLSGAFIIRRADGSTATKTQYLTNHPYYPDWQARVDDAQYQAPVLTVQSYNWQTSAPGAFAPCMFSFAWINGSWRMTAFSRFEPQAVLPPAQ